jgi:hypothetical protein
MLLFKKLFFALPFLALFYWFGFEMKSLISSDYSLLFSLDIKVFISLVMASILLVVSLLCFGIFLTLAQNYKFVLPVILVASISPIIYFTQPTGFYIAAGFLVAFGLSYLYIFKKLQSYLTFQPSSLLNPTIKTLAALIILLLSFAYYLNISEEIKNNGFEIPDSLIETAIKLATPNSGEVQGVQIAQAPTFNQESIDALRANPDLLKQYNLDESALDLVENICLQNQESTDVSESKPLVPADIAKNLIKSQFEKIISPYLNFIAPVLALLFFVTFQSLFSFIAIFLSPLILIIFWVLEKTGFVRFEKEMREVKKLVV